jgi:hypothetical protein
MDHGSPSPDPGVRHFARAIAPPPHPVLHTTARLCAADPSWTGTRPKPGPGPVVDIVHR